MRVDKTLIQTLACQLSSTLMQLLFSFDQDMRVEKTLKQTLTSQLSSTLIQLSFSFGQDMTVERTLVVTLSCRLSLRKHSSIIFQMLTYLMLIRLANLCPNAVLQRKLISLFLILFLLSYKHIVQHLDTLTSL